MLSKKITGAVLAATVLTTALSGCTPEEKRFLSAYENLARQSGYEKYYKATFDFEYSGNNEDLERYEIIIDNLEIYITQKFQGNLLEGDFNVYFNGVLYDDPASLYGEAWIKASGGGEPKFDIAVKIPLMVQAFLEPEDRKDYFYIDYYDTIAAAREDVTYLVFLDSWFYGLTGIPERIAAFGKRIELFKMIVASGAFNTDFVELGEDRNTLRLNISYEQYVDFVISFYKELETNAEMKNAYFDLLTKEDVDLMEDIQWTREEFEEFLRLYKENGYSGLKESLEEYPLFGPEGIDYSITLGENGRISSESAKISIAPRYAVGIYYISESEYEDHDVRINAYIEAETVNTEENQDISFPEITDENSYNYITEKMPIPAEGY